MSAQDEGLSEIVANGAVQYCPVPGFPGYWAGSDRTVWRETRAAGHSRAGDSVGRVPVSASKLGGDGLYMRLRVGTNLFWRAVALVHAAAFAGGSAQAEAVRRIAPMPGRKRRTEIAAGTKRTSFLLSSETVRMLEEIGQARDLTNVRALELAVSRLHKSVLRERKALPVPDEPTVDDKRAVTLPAGRPGPDPERQPRGEQHGRAKLTRAQVEEARTLKREGWTYPALAARYGTHRQTVYHAVSERTWGSG